VVRGLGRHHGHRGVEFMAWLCGKRFFFFQSGGWGVMVENDSPAVGRPAPAPAPNPANLHYATGRLSSEQKWAGANAEYGAWFGSKQPRAGTTTRRLRGFLKPKKGNCELPGPSGRAGLDHGNDHRDRHDRRERSRSKFGISQPASSFTESNRRHIDTARYTQRSMVFLACSFPFFPPWWKE